MSDRLISADKLMEAIKDHHYPLVVKGLNSTDYGMFTLGIQQVVDEQPTVDAESVRHGRWYIDAEGDVRCTVCKTKCLRDDIGINILSNYCPHCGAKVVEE